MTTVAACHSSGLRRVYRSVTCR